jgi:hypothetical protein
MRTIHFYLATVLMTSSLAGVPPASLVLADDPPSPRNNPSDVIQGDAGKGAGAQEEPALPAEATDIQERGVLPGRLAPGATAPGATLQIIAPTPSLTAIRNAIRVTSKSVSVNLRVPANLPVTVPVEVSVAYITPAQTQRQTKTYNPVTGLTILYHEAEGDGKPRSMGLDITVRELVPNGKSFSVSKQFTITPLYRASISPLKFLMATRCDTIGKSDITFRWAWPDGQTHEQKFDLGFGATKMVGLFSWGRGEFSAQANLKEPTVQFDERDSPFPSYNPMAASNRFLVPAQTQDYSFFLDEHDTGPPGSSPGSTKCKAHISYRIDRNLMTFDQF